MNYWVSFIVQDNECSKPWLCSVNNSFTSIEEAMKIIENGRQNYRVISAWIDVLENDVKTTIYHQCFVDIMGNLIDVNSKNNESPMVNIFGKELSYNVYWNDNFSFAVDIGDGELKNKNGDNYFIHCECNCDDNICHGLFEIWFDKDSIIMNIDEYDMYERDEYLTLEQMNKLEDFMNTYIESKELYL